MYGFMKIPAPMIPPMTAIVVPNKPSCRASSPPCTAFLEGFSVVVIELKWCFIPLDFFSMPFAIRAYSTTPASGYKIERGEALFTGNGTFSLGQAVHPCCKESCRASQARDKTGHFYYLALPSRLV